MFNKLWFVFVNLIFIFIYCKTIDSSIINPDLNSDLPGFTSFHIGRQYFENGKLQEAIHFFSQAIEESYEPNYSCNDFWGSEGHRSSCSDDLEEEDDFLDYYLTNYWLEIPYTVYRHSHFYLGLIHLNFNEIIKSDFHFKKSIYSKGNFNDIRSLYYRTINLINPSWLILASQTSLSLGKVEIAERLTDLAWDTKTFIAENVMEYRHWLNETYWQDFKNRGTARDEWGDLHEISILNTKSIIAKTQNEPDQAIKYISQAISYKDYGVAKGRINRERIEAAILHINRGLLYYEVGNYQSAILDFTQALQLDAFDADNYFNRGLCYLQLEDYENAKNDFCKAIELNANDSDYYRGRSLANLFNNLQAEAIDDLDKAKKIDNDILCDQNNKGLYAFAKGDLQEAIKYFSQFIQSNPNQLVGYQNRSMTYYQAGLFEEAITDCNYALAIEENEQSYGTRGLAYLALSHFIEAENDLQQAVLINPAVDYVYQNLATYYYIVGKFEQAIQYAQKALDLNASNKEESYKNLAYIYFSSGNYDKTLETCRKIINMGYHQPPIYTLQGLCLYEQGQFQDAIISYNLAIELGCKNANIYSLRGQAYYCQKEFDLAVKDFNCAIELDPSNVNLYKFRGLIYLNIQNELAAYADFLKALKLEVTYNNDETYPQERVADPVSLLQNQDKTYMCYQGVLTSFDGLTIVPFIGDYLKGATTLPNSSIIEKSKLTMPSYAWLCTLVDPSEFVVEENRQSQIDLDKFAIGLIIGLGEGGVECLKELGPFLSNLLFHPLQTTRELIKALRILMDQVDKGNWDAVSEALIPELKELYSHWDEIDDRHKGILTGKFIGHVGVGFLIGVGVFKTVAKLKKIKVIDTLRSKCGFKRKQTHISLPPEPSTPSIPTYPEKSWVMPYAGGAIIGARYYTEHALARMAPKKNLRVRAILDERKLRKAEKAGVNLYTDEYLEWMETKMGKSYSTDPRGIPPSVVEAEIANPGSTGIKVIINEKGDVITVLPNI